MTQKEVRRLFIYNPETGIIKWKTSGRGRKIKPENISDGVIDKKEGYIYLQPGGKKYLAHRLIWLYEKGVMPKLQIDHIDGDRTNNRITNLREVTPSENQFNTKAKGYFFSKERNKYRALITAYGKTTYLGDFDTELEANNAYLKGKIRIHGIEFVGRKLKEILP